MRSLDSFHIFRPGGLRRIASGIFNRLMPAHVNMRRRVLEAIKDRAGLEVGGPSRLFAASKILPIYGQAACLDNVNFAKHTSWEQNLREGGEYIYSSNKTPGRQWIREACDLRGIADESYDFLLSSHCLEHVANPLSALREWKRVIKPGGYILVVVPDQKGTFDHRRPVTTLEHLKDDERQRIPESDLTHLDEIIALHDLTLDPHAGTAAQFRQRSLKNSENRCLHHHVFDLQLLYASLSQTGWELIATERVRPIHLIAFAGKPFPGE